MLGCIHKARILDRIGWPPDCKLASWLPWMLLNLKEYIGATVGLIWLAVLHEGRCTWMRCPRRVFVCLHAMLHTVLGASIEQLCTSISFPALSPAVFCQPSLHERQKSQLSGAGPYCYCHCTFFYAVAAETPAHNALACTNSFIVAVLYAKPTVILFWFAQNFPCPVFFPLPACTVLFQPTGKVQRSSFYCLACSVFSLNLLWYDWPAL